MYVLARVLSVLIRNIINIRIIHNTRRFARYCGTLMVAKEKKEKPGLVTGGWDAVTDVNAGSPPKSSSDMIV